MPGFTAIQQCLLGNLLRLEKGYTLPLFGWRRLLFVYTDPLRFDRANQLVEATKKPSDLRFAY